MAKICNCKKCHTNYDAFLSNCPICEHTNDTFPLDHRFSNILFLTDIKLVLLAFIGAIGIFAFNVLFFLAFRNMPFDDNLKGTTVAFVTYIIVLSLLMCVINVEYKKLFVTFTKVRPFLIALICVAAVIGFYFAYVAILKAVKYNYAPSAYIDENNEMIKNLPALAFFNIVILKPICEELAYRVGFFGIIRKHNRFLAYFAAVIIYGVVHLDLTNITNINEWVNFPIYLAQSFALTALYEYEGLSSSLYANIACNLFNFIFLFAIK